MRSLGRFVRRAALAGLFVVVCTTVCGAVPAPVVVSNAWTRPTAVGMNAAGYLVITNHTRAADRLLSASSPMAAEVTLHESRMTGGVMVMRPLSDLPAPALGRVVLAPGGLHLMLRGLRVSLKVGMRVPVDMVFAHLGHLRVFLNVKQDAPPADMAGMKM